MVPPKCQQNLVKGHCARSTRSVSRQAGDHRRDVLARVAPLFSLSSGREQREKKAWQKRERNRLSLGLRRPRRGGAARMRDPPPPPPHPLPHPPPAQRCPAP